MTGKTVGLLFACIVAAMAALVAWTFWPIPGSGGRERMPDLASIPRGASIVQVDLPGQLSDAAQIGKRAFEAKCAECHGVNATGRNGMAPPLVHRIYEPSHHSDMAFVMAVRAGVRAHHWPFGNMPPVEGLTDGDARYIARYVRELQRENGIN